MAEITFGHAIPFKQNGRQCWVSKLTVNEICQITMPAQGEQLSLFNITNRAIEEPHVGSIARYLETPNWAFPAIILAVAPGTLKSKSKSPSLNCDAQSIKVLDGQHRISALAKHAHSEHQDLLAEELAVTIIEVKDDEDQTRIWLDFAKNKQISGAWRDAIDNATPFTRTAKLAAEESEILKGRTLIGKTNIKSHSNPELITLSGLKLITASIALGLHRRAAGNAQKAYESSEKQHELKDRIVQFFDQFLPQCQPNYELLADPQNMGQKMLYVRSGTCAYDTPTLNLIANLHARWIESRKPQEQLANFVGQLQLSKTAPENWMSRKQVYDTSNETYAKASNRAVWNSAASAAMDEANATEQTES